MVTDPAPHLDILTGWIGMVRTTGGIEEGGIRIAFNAASAICWSIVDRDPRLRRMEISRLGVCYLAAFMLSTAISGGGDIADIFWPFHDLSDALEYQAEASEGSIAYVLRDAARYADLLTKGALLAAGAYCIVRVSSDGRGKGVGRIG